jgi:hypothetical protein
MKRTIIFIFCLVAIALVATSCYTACKCPAYGHYSQVVDYNIELKIKN